MKRNYVKIRLTKERLIALSVFILTSIAIILLYPHLYSLYKSTQPIKKIVYFNVPMEFREDLRLAKNISVIPNEDSIRRIFWNRGLKKITIAILNSTNQTSLIGVEAYEITFKLTTFYTIKRMNVEIKGREISEAHEISGDSSNPVIVIIPPELANETSVRVEDYNVYISGKSLKELDLATIKFIMTVLHLELE